MEKWAVNIPSEMVPMLDIIRFLLLTCLNTWKKTFSSFNPFILILLDNKSEFWQVAQKLFGINLILAYW